MSNQNKVLFPPEVNFYSTLEQIKETNHLKLKIAFSPENNIDSNNIPKNLKCIIKAVDQITNKSLIAANNLGFYKTAEIIYQNNNFYIKFDKFDNDYNRGKISIKLLLLNTTSGEIKSIKQIEQLEKNKATSAWSDIAVITK